MMYVYARTPIGTWVVGYYKKPDHQWIPESYHNHRGQAEARVVALNAGTAMSLAVSQSTTTQGDDVLDLSLSQEQLVSQIKHAVQVGFRRRTDAAGNPVWFVEEKDAQYLVLHDTKGGMYGTIDSSWQHPTAADRRCAYLRTCALCRQCGHAEWGWDEWVENYDEAYRIVHGELA